MPNFFFILDYYTARSRAALSGALEEELKNFSGSELGRVAANFLTEEERTALPRLGFFDRASRLRKGEQRFHRWEEANPDIVDLLERRARSKLA
ncbi:hypothetical protein [Actibacterium ureilyticum]|uniref:hypothetical protein n=1 Tax=Actibacterium ureilyticum TaxID=1590614 RepID=UPI000BAAC67F|nr:hypothetical protein [Actibacterium ureilyticum]